MFFLSFSSSFFFGFPFLSFFLKNLFFFFFLSFFPLSLFPFLFLLIVAYIIYIYCIYRHCLLRIEPVGYFFATIYCIGTGRTECSCNLRNKCTPIRHNKCAPKKRPLYNPQLTTRSLTKIIPFQRSFSLSYVK